MNSSLLTYSISIVIAILPCLSVYNFLPGTNLGSFIILVLTLLAISLGVKHIDREELSFFFLILYITLIDGVYYSIAGYPWFDLTLMLHNIWSILLCFLPLITILHNVDITYFVKTAFGIGILASLIVVWQRMTLIATGSFNNDIFLPWFEVSRELDTMSMRRPSAFFTEPAHFATFMLPVFYLSILLKRYLYSSLFFFSILCSGSSTGFLLLVIVSMGIIYTSRTKHKLLKSILVLLCLGILFGAILIMYPQIILENIEKLSGVEEGNSDIRLLGPLSYLQYYDLWEHIFGITLNQLGNFLDSKNIAGFGTDNSNFANGIIYMYLSYGLIGLSVLIRYLYRKWKYSFEAKGFMLIFIGILASAQVLFNTDFLYLTSYIILSKRIVLSESHY